MTIKYESELIKNIVDTRGHKKSSLHYESECIGTWIEETKGAYPKLCDYESEWLNYINGNEIGNEIGKFPYETVTADPTATVNNVVPYAYKSAILKGQTLVNLLDMNNLNQQNSITYIAPLTTAKSEITIIATTKTANKSPKVSLYTEGGKWVRNVNTSFTNNKIHYKGESGLYVKELVFTTNNNASDSYSFESVEQFREQGFIVIEGNYKKDVPSYFEGMQPVKMPVLTTSNEDGTKTNILTVNEGVTLRSNGDICDELNLLTGQLTQRIDEDGEVLSQEVVKTVALKVVNQDNETLNKLKPLEGTMNISVTGNPINPIGVFEVPVEAITQNLSSFIGEEK